MQTFNLNEINFKKKNYECSFYNRDLIFLSSKIPYNHYSSITNFELAALNGKQIVHIKRGFNHSDLFSWIFDKLNKHIEIELPKEFSFSYIDNLSSKINEFRRMFRIIQFENNFKNYNMLELFHNKNICNIFFFNNIENRNKFIEGFPLHMRVDNET